jgi:hypothetical protein
MNEFVCTFDNDMGNHAILSHSLTPEIKEEARGENEEIWKMHFDGAHSRLGTSAGIVFISPQGDVLNFSYRLEFEATNNIAEYEALLLGLELALEWCYHRICTCAKPSTRSPNLV